MSSVHPAITAATRDTAAPIFIGGHSASLSAQIVGQVRDALFAKKLKPGDFLGTEKDLAARFGVSRIVARDALRTLQALGIADIKMGKGGGARVARGNPRLFAEALMSAREAYTRSCRDFHLAVAEASHNRVLVTQLASLQHVSWPTENRTLTPQVARRVLDVHRELATLIEMRDAAGARKLIDDHVKMIRARRVAEHAHDTHHCC